MNTAREFKCRDKRVTRLVNSGIERMTEVFAAAVRRAQSEGDIPRSSDPRALGAFFLTGVSGLRTLLQSRADPALLNDVAARLLRAMRAAA